MLISKYVCFIYNLYLQVLALSIYYFILFYLDFTRNTKEKQSKTKQNIKQLQNSKITKFQRMLIKDAIDC